MESITRHGRFGHVLAVALAGALAGALSLPAVADDCEWHVEPVAVNIVQAAGTTSFDFQFQTAVSLEHVSAVNIDAVKSTLHGPGETTVSFNLLSGSDPVLFVFGTNIFGGSTPVCFTHRHWQYNVDSTDVVDGLRITVFNSGGATTDVTGLHDGGTMHVVFTVAPWAPDGPHLAVPVGSFNQEAVAAPGVGFWHPVDLDPPVPADGLRHFNQTGMGINGGTAFTSGCVQSQLILDNGVTLSIDDWMSPSPGGPPDPDDHWYSTTGSLMIDDETAKIIAGANIIQWRWRLIADGSGTVTVFPPGQSTIYFFYDSVAIIPADVNEDGTVDVQDLVEVVTAWGDFGGPADVNEDGIVDVLDLVEVIVNWGGCS